MDNRTDARLWLLYRLSTAIFIFGPMAAGIGLGHYQAVTFSVIEGLPVFPLFFRSGWPEMGAVMLTTSISLFFINDRRFYLIYSLAIAYMSLSYFTAQGAFLPFTVVLLSFYFFNRKNDLEQVARNAQATIGLIFVSAAVHKINPAFLSGTEFKWGDFHAVSRDYFKPALEWFSQYRIVPPLTIFFEFSIGLICFSGAPIGAILIIGFLLPLTILQPNVTDVFYAFAPLLILGFPVMLIPIRWALRRWRHSLPVFLLTVTGTVAVIWAVSTPDYFWKTLGFNLRGSLAFAISALLFHPKFLKIFLVRSIRELRNLDFKCLSRTLRQPWVAAFTLYCFLPLAFQIQEPYSFTMFSGRTYLNTPEKIHIGNLGACRSLWHEFNLIWIATVEYSQPEAKSCDLKIYIHKYYPKIYGELCRNRKFQPYVEICSQQ